MTKKEKSERIKKYALELGFDDVGIVKAEFLFSEESNLNQWLEKGFQAEMTYLERNIDKRLDPRLLVDNSKSIIVVLKNYYPAELQIEDTYNITKYAYGKDYHDVIRNDLEKIYSFISSEIEPAKGRIFVDSAPVLEKKWAQKANLGWIGKNSLLLTKKGSFFFIAEIIVDIELEYENSSFKDYCGQCTKCIEACPTNAIESPYVLNSNLCISYQTIEKKGEFDENFNLKFNDYIFGCDICQDVCPWNSKSKIQSDERFKPNFLLLELKKNDWEKLTKETFDNIFNKSAVKRTKYAGLMRNIKYVKSNKL